MTNIKGIFSPLAYFGYGSLKVVPAKTLPIDVVIACWPWAEYLSAESVDIKTSKYIRIHPQSTVADAKISGHYVNSIVAGLQIRESKYHEVLMCDSNGFVAEGSAENIFIVKDGVLYTTPLGTILAGITRETVIDIAISNGIEVVEKYFKPEKIITSDEAFFCGTAVEITPISSLDDKIIGSGRPGSITQHIQRAYQDIVHAKNKEFKQHCTCIEINSREVVKS